MSQARARAKARAKARARGYSSPLVGAMGQGQSTNLTDKASSRPLPSTSTLEKICGERYTYEVANVEDCIYPMDAMRKLGFVLVKNVFTEEELRAIASTTDAMVEACKENKQRKG